MRRAWSWIQSAWSTCLRGRHEDEMLDIAHAQAREIAIREQLRRLELMRELHQGKPGKRVTDKT